MKLIIEIPEEVMKATKAHNLYPSQLDLICENVLNGTEALEIAVHYITILLVCLISLYLLHIFRNALQAMEVSVWSMISGFIECAARVFLSKAVIHWMGSDALFVSEPVAWIGALLSVMIPYLYYSKKLLKTEK